MAQIRGENQHDAKEEIGNQADNLDQSQPELGFSECFDAQQLESEEEELPSTLALHFFFFMTGRRDSPRRAGNTPRWAPCHSKTP
jgi:hypothetical protein